MIDLIIDSIKILLRKKTRTILTILGIVVGVSSVIIINNISRSGNTALTDEIDGLGMGGLSIMLKNQNAALAENELEAIEKLPYVEYAMPLMYESTDAYIREEKNPIYLWGIDRTAKDMIDLSIVHGRFITAGDISSYAKVCLMDQSLAKSCYGTDQVVGKRIRINSGGAASEYKIVGVVKTGSGILENMMGSYIPTFMYVPYTTMQGNLSTGNFSQIAVKVSAGYDDDEAGDNIIKTIERSNGSHGSYMVTNLAKQKESISHIISIFAVVLTCVGIVSLFVAGLSIMNVMLVSVTERTREIGIKKALGASSGIIVFEFLSEAVLITIAGAAAGLLFGTAVSMIGANMLGLTLAPKADIMLYVVLFSLAVGIIFGIYPALKAARLKPVDALRTF